MLTIASLIEAYSDIPYPYTVGLADERKQFLNAHLSYEATPPDELLIHLCLLKPLLKRCGEHSNFNVSTI